MKQKTTERETQKAIREYLEYSGWRVWKLRTPLYSHGKGLPDILAIKNGIQLWLEIKSPTATYKETPEQIEFLKAIKSTTQIKGGVARSIEDVDNILLKL